MTTMWDRAVRALHPLFKETDPRDAAFPLAYFCGGPERRCEHRTCDAVSLLAAADCLQEPHATRVQLDVGGRVVAPLLSLATRAPDLPADTVPVVHDPTERAATGPGDRAYRG